MQRSQETPKFDKMYIIGTTKNLKYCYMFGKYRKETLTEEGQMDYVNLNRMRK